MEVKGPLSSPLPMIALSAGPLLLAFLITVIELTEVVALVFALQGETGSIRHGAYGAVAGTSVVGAIALGAGAALTRVPSDLLLAASAVALFGFGVFLFRSTLRAYRRARAAATGRPGGPEKGGRALQFGGGFTVGAIEATEAVIVLISLAAAGEAGSALVGAVVGVVVLVVLASLLHGRIRRIKVPQLKLGATALLFTFAIFWSGEAVRLPWPYADLFLIPLFLLVLLAVRGALALALGPTPAPVETKG